MSVLAASSTVVKVASQSTMPQHQCLLPPQGNVKSRLKEGRVSAATEQRGLMAEEQVPHVDLAVVRSGDNPEARIAVEKIASACKEWGFFQVTNHGVPMEFVRKFRRQALALFSLPSQQKDSVSRSRWGGWGYDFRPNSGPMEVLQVNSCDRHQVLTYAQALFPDSSEDFIALVEEAKTVLHTLAMEILDILIRGLGADAKHFEAHRKESEGVLRANYYHQSKAPDQLLGLNPHVDGNLLTILHQQDVCGLEVLKDGNWIPISPQHDALCINVGDILQVLTNGQYKSVQHRAVAPKTQPRLSFAYFLIPARSVSLVPAPELVDALHPPPYRPFTWEDFVEVLKEPGRPFPSVLPFFEQN